MNRRAWPAIVAGLSLALYLPTLAFDRTLDDVAQTRGSGERETRTLTSVWTSPYWEGTHGGLYRPVTSSTYVLEGRYGTPLWSRHLVNTVLHAAVVGLLVHMASALGLAGWPAGVVGILFALHPTHVEVVAGLVGRAELLSGLWMLLALTWHVRRLDGHPGSGTATGFGSAMRWFAGTSLLAFLAAGSKESAWLLPLFALPLHAAGGKALRRAGPAFAGYCLGIGAHFVMRHAVLGGWLNAPYADVSAGENPLVLLHGFDRFVGGVRVAGIFAGHLVLPFRLSPDYSGATIPLPGTPFDAEFLAGILLLAGPLVLAGRAWRRWRTAEGGVMLAACSWIGWPAWLSMNVFLTLATVVADRLLFWPSAGWSLLLGAALGKAIPGSGVAVFPARSLRIGVLAGIGLLLMVYAGVVVGYLPTWRNNLTLFSAAREATPLSSRVWSGYAQALGYEGRVDEALEAFHHTQRLSPGYQPAWSQEAALLVGLGRFEDARAPLREALRLNPRDRAARTNEGILWVSEGRYQEAASRFRDVLTENPDLAVARRFLAVSLQHAGEYAEAVEAWRRYLESVPEDPQGLNDLAWILATRFDRAEEAETLARKAVAIWPENSNLHDTLAETLVRQGRIEEAAQVARDALALGDSAGARHLDRFLRPEAPDTSR